MIKKIICLIILSQLFLSTAHASGTETLRNAFDEMTYSLTVEWDQKDPAIAQDAINTFRNNISGTSDLEKEIFFQSLLKNRADQDVKKFVTALKENSYSQEQALNELNSLILTSYGQGASFVPARTIVLGVLGGAALIFVAGLVMWEMGDPQVFGEDGWK